MARYFIEDVMCDIGPGGMACGPIDGPVVAEAKIRTDKGEVFFFCLAEVSGIPNYFKTDRSTFKEQIEPEMSDEMVEYLNGHYVGEIDDYVDLYANPDMEDRDLFRYITYIVRSDWDECRSFMEATKGKWLDEIETPISDDEQDYLDELAAEAEDDE